ncbi:MAG: hypothetical protein J6Y20_09000 [Lachnospiraceae bacterium]|nr:hypothetical protein [Lachnospiraceae bacterium]
MKREHAYKLRDLLHKASASLSDTDALDGIELFPQWKTDTAYEAGVRVRFEEKLYRCEQAHTSQEDWTPDITPALWTDVAEPGKIPVWRQPTGAQDAYMKDDLVYYPDYDGDVYISLYDNNVWEPIAYGWELVEV